MISTPRQSGKSTLIQQLAMQDRKHITLDDVNLLDIARNDPIGLIRDANFVDWQLRKLMKFGKLKLK